MRDSIKQWAQRLAVMGVFVATGPVSAATAWYQGTIQMIYPMSDGSFAIGVPTVLPTCSGNGSGGVYLFVSPGQNAVTADGAKNLLATLLMAFAQGRTISVAYDDSTLYCYVNRLLVQ
jgi:hypothetical protein